MDDLTNKVKCDSLSYKDANKLISEMGDVSNFTILSYFTVLL